MDFPANLRTNTFEIASISQIAWKFLVRQDAPSTDPDESVTALLISESQLRNQGHHVFADCANGGIWAFSLSRSNHETLVNDVACLDVEEKCGGLVHVRDLSNLPSSVTEKAATVSSPSDTRFSNLQSFKANARPGFEDAVAGEARSADHGVQLETIYFYLVHTLCRSLTFILAQQSNWSIFDHNSCINEQTLGFGLLRDPNITEFVKFNCKWTLSGSIRVSVIKQTAPKLHRLSDTLSKDKNGLFLGLRCWLMLIHCNGRICDILPFWKRKYNDNDLTSLKRSASEALNILEYEVPFNDSWVILELSDDLHPESSRMKYFLWPASLCFISTPRKLFEELDGHTEDFTILDPVARAEAWYHERHEREHAAKNDQGPAIEADQQNHFGDALSPLNHRSLLQDPSGVYPTPPDGANSQNNDTPMKDDDDRLSHQSPAEAYGRKTEDYQDMLGDHGMDLTEADFEFFDDPGDAELQLATPAPTGDPPPGVLSPQTASGEPRESSALNDQPQSGETAPLPLHPHDTPVSLDIVTTQNEVETVDVMLTDASPMMEQELAGKITDKTVAKEPTKMPDDENPNDGLRTIHAHNTRADKSDLDEKYALSGRYGFPSSSDGASQKPLNRSEPTEKTIPRIGDAEGSASDSDDEADQGSWELSSRGSLSDDLDDSEEEEKWNAMANERDTLFSIDFKLLHLEIPPITWLAMPSRGITDLIDFTDDQNEPQQFSAEPHRFMQMTQLVTDHAIAQTLDTKDKLDKGSMPNTDLSPDEAFLRWVAEKILTNLVPTEALLPARLFEVAENQDAAAPSTQPSFQLVRMGEPEFCVRRMDTKLDILPAALRLWEDLGLEAMSGAKDLKAIGIPFRKQNYLKQPIERFLTQMRDAYIACNLGLHETCDQELPEEASFDTDHQVLGTALGQITPSQSSVVIYVVCDKLSPATLREVSEATVQVINSYAAKLARNEREREVIVQLVPGHLVFNPSYLVAPEMEDLKKLAFEVYDRCAPIQAGSLESYRVAPSICLARSIPNQIDFQLTPEASSAKLFHDIRLHVAYEWNTGQEWLTASWTDNTGALSWHASYVIGCQTDVWTEFAKAAREVIETTFMMLHPRSRPARVFICKHGSYAKDEIRAWQALVSQSTSSNSFSFLTVNADTSLQLASPPVKEVFTESMDQTLTPVSTPTATGNSPDVMTTPAATGFESEADTRLIDIRDETWAFIPASPLECDEYMPSNEFLPSHEGYIVKRNGVVEEDGVTLLAVQVICSSEETSDELLMEVLQMYHKLAFLARLRNTTDSINGMLPLHVAAARKGWKAVTSAVRWAPINHG